MTALIHPESASEIEREAEISRARLAMTLDQLRDNLTPEHLADEVLGHARQGATAVLTTLGDSAAKHPVPTLLISAGCAALLYGVARGSSAGRDRDIPAPPIAYAGNVPARLQERGATTAASPASASRWAILGERPVVTAVLGLVFGRLMAAALPPE